MLLARSYFSCWIFLFTFSSLILVLDCIWLLGYIQCFHWQCHMPDLFLIISSSIFFFFQIPEIPLSLLFSCLSDICPFAFWILKPVGNLFFGFTSPGIPFVLRVDCAVVVPTVRIFGWSPPGDSFCGESTQKPPFPSEVLETVVMREAGGLKTFPQESLRLREVYRVFSAGTSCACWTWFSRPGGHKCILK